MNSTAISIQINPISTSTEYFIAIRPKKKTSSGSVCLDKEKMSFNFEKNFKISHTFLVITKKDVT